MLFAPLERGQGLVEYALILVLIAIIVFAAVELFGTTLNTTFETISSRINALSP